MASEHNGGPGHTEAAPGKTTPLHDRDTQVIYPGEAADDQWAPGDCVEGRYEVSEVRGGRGKTGMGVVCIVEDRDGNRFAMKTFQRRFALRLDFIRRFIREARTWMLAGFHPNIAHAYHFDIVRAVPLLFIEYVPSDTTGRHTLAHYLANGPLTVAQALSFAVQLCRGMHHATAAVPALVHRDLKPDNLLVSPDGVLKVTDFGLARVRGELAIGLEAEAESDGRPSGLTEAGWFFGTPAYMAPEQFADAAEVSGAADIYAFGCCLHEMLAGRPPFEAKAGTTLDRLAALQRMHREVAPPRLCDIRSECPRAVEELVLRCLAKAPGARPRHFAELAEALESIMARLGIPMPDERRADPLPRLVAEQVRSLSLLDGYERAVRLQKLRQSHELCPYTFHLALASYFHVTNDHREERRQLEKALRARNHELGDEAVRRLAERCIADGDHKAAESCLSAFLAEQPAAAPHVLEPRVRLAIARGNHGEARRLLEAAPRGGLREMLLHIELLEASGDYDALTTRCATMAREELDRLVHALTIVAHGARIGLHKMGDAETLAEVLALLRPEVDTATLRQAECAAWPDLTGIPDFADGMAWLSFALGKLADHGQGTGDAPAETIAHCARLLDHPHRLREYRERDEAWFWQHDPVE